MNIECDFFHEKLVLVVPILIIFDSCTEKNEGFNSSISWVSGIEWFESNEKHLTQFKFAYYNIFYFFKLFVDSMCN